MKVQGRRQSDKVIDARTPYEKRRHNFATNLAGRSRERMAAPLEYGVTDMALNQFTFSNPNIILQRMLATPTAAPSETFRQPSAEEIARNIRSLKKG